MKPNLLDDTLQEGDYPPFRDKLRGEFIREAEDAQERRRSGGGVAMSASIALIATSLFYMGLHRNTPPSQAAKEAVPTIHSIALTQSEIFETTPSEVSVIDPHPASFSELTTAPDPDVQILNDADLLNMFQEHPTALLA